MINSARRGGIRPRDWIRPDECCGPEKPYHTSQKVRNRKKSAKLGENGAENH